MLRIKQEDDKNFDRYEYSSDKH